MFLFKLTLPVLGTATLGAVGTGIYYGVETWKNNLDQKGGEDKNGVENGKGDERGEGGPEQKPDSPPKDPSLTQLPQFPEASQEVTK